MNKTYNGQVNAGVNAAIFIKSNQEISLGSSGTLELRKDSKIGELIESFDVTSDKVSISAWELMIRPSEKLPYESEIYLVMSDGFIVSAINGSSFSGFDVNGDKTFKFNTAKEVILPPEPQPELKIGDSLEGGIIIDKVNDIFTLISPKKSEMNLTMYEIDKAIQKTEEDTGTTGWYLPSSYELQNYTNHLESDKYYWTSTEVDLEHSYALNTNNRVPYSTNKKESHLIRLFKKTTSNF
jgi:hypothetical protein